MLRATLYYGLRAKAKGMSGEVCDRQHRGRALLSYEEAAARLSAELRPLDRPAEPVPLCEAFGRVLAQQVVLDRDEPPLPRSAMDGYAVRSSDGLAPRRLRGTVHAGSAEAPPVGAGEAVAVMTGGTVPDGADAVVPVEEARRELRDGAALVVLQAVPREGLNVRRAAEMGRAGRVILEAGRVLAHGDLAAAAGCGADPVLVRARPRAAVLSTGDEVVPWRERPAPHQVRDSNRLAAAHQLARAGAEVVASRTAADRPAELRAALLELCAAADVVVTIGGVSAGERDHLPEAFAGLGAVELFHGVSIQPGKPVWAGRRGPTWLLGLPGNPVSSFVVLELFGVPLVRGLAGAGVELPRLSEAGVAGAAADAKGRERFLPADLRVGLDGVPVVTPRPETGSGDWTSLALAEALLHLPARSRLSPGAPARFIRL